MIDITAFLLGMVVGLIILITKLEHEVRGFKKVIQEAKRLMSTLINILDERLSSLEFQVEQINTELDSRNFRFNTADEVHEIDDDRENYEQMLQKDRERIKRILEQIDKLFKE